MKVYQTKINGSNPVNQNNAISTVSEKYQFLPTNDLIQTIESKGFIQKDVTYSNVRKIEKSGFQNHLVIFEHPDGKIDGQNLNLILKLMGWIIGLREMLNTIKEIIMMVLYLICVLLK